MCCQCQGNAYYVLVFSSSNDGALPRGILYPILTYCNLVKAKFILVKKKNMYYLYHGFPGYAVKQLNIILCLNLQMFDGNKFSCIYFY
jgi:hypothetical protein